MCLEPERDHSLIGTADRRTGELQFDFGFSAVSLEFADSDRLQKAQRTEEFVVVTMKITILASDPGRL